MVITACLGLLIFNIIYYFMNQKIDNVINKDSLIN